MTKKMTITLEEELIEELDSTALAMGKKKAQIVREALQSYLPSQQKARLESEWRETNASSIQAYNERVEKHGVFSDGLRSF
ncbi:MAG: type II toxin-antitoxin system CcdA family antitoxin [Campylobacterota bacterium]